MKYRIKHKLFILLCGLLLLTLRSAPIHAQAPTSGVGVFYIGPEDIVSESINLAHPYIVRVDQPELAQVIVINNARISEQGLRFYGEQVRNNRVGLVIFSGNLYPDDLSDLGALLGISAFGMTKIHTPSEIAVEGNLDALQESATWSSAPDLYARTVISNPNILLPIITTETGQPVIQRVRGREPAQTLIVGAWLDAPSNADWAEWPYYHYLIYRLIIDAAGRSRVLTYADYPLSPVPQRISRWGIAGTGIGVILGTAAVFYLARRYRYMRSGDWRYQTAQKVTRQADQTGWNSVGFHRPLAGILVLLPLNLLLFLVLVRYRLHTLPEVLSPNPQAFSSWQLVEYWAKVIWLLLDAGTGIAVLRYFAASYVHRPHRAFTYFQFYCWWQLFIGAVQLGVVAILSAIVLPSTSFAHLTYFILLQAVARFPGFLTVFVLFFRAIQRLDYKQYLSFFLTYGSAAFQALTYLLFRTWGTSLPIFGQGQISILGLGTGLYAAEWLIFILGMFLFIRQGYKLEALFLPVSDTQAGRQLLSFGIRTAVGTLAVPAVALIQIYILNNVSPNLKLAWQNWVVAITIASIFDLLMQQFYQNLIPALTEAIILEYKTLLRYYLTQGVRYGMWLSVFIFVTFISLGEQLVDVAVSGAYNRIAEVLLLLLAIATFRWATWLVDNLLLASERPGLRSALIILEQVLYGGGSLLLAPQYGLTGFLSAYALGFLIRTMFTWFLMQRLIVRVHIYVWQTFISPLLSGMLIYYLLHVMLVEVTPVRQTSFVFAALPLGLWIYAFFTALFGGWDDASIQEFERAVQLSGIGKPYAWVLWQCIRLGARISPLHGRFPIVIAGIAEEQATAISFTRSASK